MRKQCHCCFQMCPISRMILFFLERLFFDEYQDAQEWNLSLGSHLKGLPASIRRNRWLRVLCWHLNSISFIKLCPRFGNWSSIDCYNSSYARNACMHKKFTRIIGRIFCWLVRYKIRTCIVPDKNLGTDFSAMISNDFWYQFAILNHNSCDFKSP